MLDFGVLFFFTSMAIFYNCTIPKKTKLKIVGILFYIRSLGIRIETFRMEIGT